MNGVDGAAPDSIVVIVVIVVVVVVVIIAVVVPSNELRKNVILINLP